METQKLLSDLRKALLDQRVLLGKRRTIVCEFQEAVRQNRLLVAAIRKEIGQNQYPLVIVVERPQRFWSSPN